MFLQTYQGWPFQIQVRRCQRFPVCSLKILWMSISLTYVCCLHVGSLLVKDEYDYDNQQSHSSSESHLQTIQHPPARPGPQEIFISPSLLPPSEGSGSASTSAFSTISVGPSSEKLHGDHTYMQNTIEDTVCASFCQSEINSCDQVFKKKCCKNINFLSLYK